MVRYLFLPSFLIAQRLHASQLPTSCYSFVPLFRNILHLFQSESHEQLHPKIHPQTLDRPTSVVVFMHFRPTSVFFLHIRPKMATITMQIGFRKKFSSCVFCELNAEEYEQFGRFSNPVYFRYFTSTRIATIIINIVKIK